MFVTEKERKSLLDSLNYCYKNELPKPYANDGSIWAYGIAKVTKCDNSTCYVVVRNFGDKNPSIARDFGNVSKVVRFDEIYPTIYLNNETMPDLRKHSDIVNFLVLHGEDETRIKSLLSSKIEGTEQKEESVAQADKKKVKDLVIKYALLDFHIDMNEREELRKK